MKIAFIANPTAGRGRTQRFLDDFSESGVVGADVAVHWTERAGHATEIARNCADVDVVCAVGGDGTVHEVVTGMMPSPRPLAIIATGSGNDFASMFGCPTSAAELGQVIQGGFGIRTDVLQIGDRYCVNTAGIGFEAQVTKESRSIKRLRGLPLYLTAVFKAMMDFDCPNFRIEMDNGKVVTGERLMITIGNGVRAGGGFYLTPDANPDDGLIDLCIVEKMGRLKMLGLLPKAIPGKHVGEPGVLMSRSTTVTVASDQPFHMHIDGEYMGTQASPVRATVVPRVLPVLCMKDAPIQAQHPIEQIL
jgi:diacylglycerol kinase (ATP)